MSRIMLARMTTLEEGFRDMLKEVKDWRRGSDGATTPVAEGPKRRVKEKGKRRVVMVGSGGRRRSDGASGGDGAGGTKGPMGSSL